MEKPSGRPLKTGFKVPTKSEQDTKSHKHEDKINALSDCTNIIQAQEKKKVQKKLKLNKKTLEQDNGEKSQTSATLKDKTVSLHSKLTDEEYEDIFKSVLDVEKSEISKNKASAIDKHSLQKQETSENNESVMGAHEKKDSKKKRIQESEKENGKAAEKPKKNQMKYEREQVLSAPTEDYKNEENAQKVPTVEKPKKRKMKHNADHVLTSTTPTDNEEVEKIEKPKQKKMKHRLDQVSIAATEDVDGEEGTWIQCTNSLCNKWRYVDDIQDPLSVPDIWECSMNSDKHHKSCDDPEEMYDEDEHILTKYTVGSVVWVKMDGFPWWPGIVECDPDYDTYFELPNEQCLKPTMYHVTFFGKRVSRAWIRPMKILPYLKKTSPKCGFSKKHNTFRHDFESSLKDADEASQMALKNRLLKFGFSVRYASQSKSAKSGKYDHHINCKEDSDEEEWSETSIGSPQKKVMIAKKAGLNVPEKLFSEKKKLKIAKKAGFNVPGQLISEKKKMKIAKNNDFNVPGQLISEKKKMKIDKKSNNKASVEFISEKNSKPEIKDPASLDQHVPDITQPVLEFEEETCLSQGRNDKCDVPSHGVKGSKASSALSEIKNDFDIMDSDIEELDLDIDPVPDIDDKKTIPFEVMEDKNDDEEFELILSDEEKNLDDDKWRFGHFMGHCSDHRSDSDPLDFIED